MGEIKEGSSYGCADACGCTERWASQGSTEIIGHVSTGRRSWSCVMHVCAAVDVGGVLSSWDTAADGDEDARGAPLNIIL